MRPINLVPHRARLVAANPVDQELLLLGVSLVGNSEFRLGSASVDRGASLTKRGMVSGARFRTAGTARGSGVLG